MVILYYYALVPLIHVHKRLLNLFNNKNSHQQNCSILLGIHENFFYRVGLYLFDHQDKVINLCFPYNLRETKIPYNFSQIYQLNCRLPSSSFIYIISYFFLNFYAHVFDPTILNQRLADKPIKNYYGVGLRILRKLRHFFVSWFNAISS